MISNLKDKIDPTLIGNFDMGSIDACDDKLLNDCFCETNSIRDFLKGGKEFLVGSKGAGKSAIFILLNKKVRVFNNPKNLEQIVILIDQPMEYVAIRKLLDKIVKNELSDSEFFNFWEIYILYRILLTIKESHNGLFKKLDDSASVFMENFSDERSSMKGFLSGIKGSAGIKLNMSNEFIPLPDFHISAEFSGDKVDTDTDTEIKLHNIDSIKNNICSILKDNNSCVYVLVDNLDDFTSREDFAIQKEVIQGVAESCKYYKKFNGINIKVALRPELYEKLKFSQLGGRDKIEARAVHIRWRDDDIRSFIGERLSKNINKYFKKIEGGITTNRSIIFELFHRTYNAFTNILFKSNENTNKVSERLLNKKNDERNEMSLDKQDKINKDMITLIFPRKIIHYDSSGNLVDECDIFSYISSHFCFSKNNVTPRIYMRFLSLVFSICANKYEKNKVECIGLDENNEYPIVKREYMLHAYRELQEETRINTISSISYEPWKVSLSLILDKQNKHRYFSFKNIKKIIKEYTDEETRDFLAYCVHAGVLHCENSNSTLFERKYNFPIIYQRIWN